ncbi:hypothetical protein [Sphingobacterium psychroaquaticum]|uniref:hypothetical protein n=1 Tax=Sphingobacterium psychroaquaticum TaxID=561061 RepID=UPI0019D2DEA0|nr:hypothetical protein [Sphingobacterium psychroaquaticum]
METANVGALRYAYAQILGGVPYLFLFADHQHYISTELLGFEDVYRELSKLFPLDNQAFLRVCKEKKEDEKVKIWAKKESQNYQILREYDNNTDLGYEVYTEPKRTITWDTTYEELEASGLVEGYFSDYGTKYLRFKHPVRIEGVLINQLELYVDNVLPNRPIMEYFVDLYDDTNTDKSYKELRELWIDEGVDIDQYGYERSDQCYLRFEFTDGIDASICYTYDEESGYDDGSTSLHFYNVREYPSFLENKAYEDVMEISDFMSFCKPLDISISHMDNDGIKHIPPKAKALLNAKSGIWVDQLNQKVGFVGVDTALVLDSRQIAHFEFQNVLPAKGGGYADFTVHLTTGNYLYIFMEDTYYFDQFAARLRQLTRKKVIIPEAYYNC